MDWIWQLFEAYIMEQLGAEERQSQDAIKGMFFKILGNTTGTLYVMEPRGDTIVFRGLGRWLLKDVPDLLTDPNAYIDSRFGGGKFKLNFHHNENFVATHNFRTYGEELWRGMKEYDFS